MPLYAYSPIAATAQSPRLVNVHNYMWRSLEPAKTALTPVPTEVRRTACLVPCSSPRTPVWSSQGKAAAAGRSEFDPSSEPLSRSKHEPSARRQPFLAIFCGMRRKHVGGGVEVSDQCSGLRCPHGRRAGSTHLQRHAIGRHHVLEHAVLRVVHEASHIIVLGGRVDRPQLEEVERVEAAAGRLGRPGARVVARALAVPEVDGRRAPALLTVLRGVVPVVGGLVGAVGGADLIEPGGKEWVCDKRKSTAGGRLDASAYRNTKTKTRNELLGSSGVLSRCVNASRLPNSGC